MKELEDSRLISFQKEILEELYVIRENLNKEFSKLAPGDGSAAHGSSGASKEDLEALYKIRDHLNEELKKSHEAQEAATSKLNFRIEHLKKNLLQIYEVFFI